MKKNNVLKALAGAVLLTGGSVAYGSWAERGKTLEQREAISQCLSGIAKVARLQAARDALHTIAQAAVAQSMWVIMSPRERARAYALHATKMVTPVAQQAYDIAAPAAQSVAQFATEKFSELKKNAPSVEQMRNALPSKETAQEFGSTALDNLQKGGRTLGSMVSGWFAKKA